MTIIAVIDYGMGNLRSVTKALEHVAPDQDIILTSDAATIHAADRVVFPGQGAAGACMRALENYAVRPGIEDAIKNKPFLGICMGLQVLLERSEENGGTDCLGYYPGAVRYFGADMADKKGGRLKIPHMGWNEVSQKKPHPLWQGIADKQRFYFVHSYFVQPTDNALTVGEAEYGHTFTAAIARDNVFAVQFHPEKSADAGLQLLKNFSTWNGEV